MALSFARDIRLLFTREDLDCMAFAFDLGNYDEVVAEAETIYGRLADKSMPPDNPWPDGHIAQFRQWIDAGLNP